MKTPPRMTLLPGGARAAVFVALMLLGAAPAMAAANQFEWHAHATITRNGRALDVRYSGIVPAADQAAAEVVAKSDLARMIAKDYQGYRLTPGTLVMRTEPIPTGVEDDRVTIRLLVNCVTWRHESDPRLVVGPFTILSEDKEIDTFQVRVVTTVDGEENGQAGRLRTIGRGASNETRLSLVAWRGEIFNDDAPRTIQIKLTAGWDGKTVETGEIHAVLQNVDGRLAVEWLPVRAAHRLAVGRGGPCYTSRWRLDGGGIALQLSATASRASEVAAHFQEKDEELRAEARGFEKNLQSAGEQIRVVNGFVQADAINSFGKRTQLLSGGIFIITSDAEAGSAFQERVFPNRKDVHLVKDEREARDFLEREWARAKQTIFKNKSIIESTVKTTFWPKDRYTVQEQVLKQPPRAPGR